MTTKLATIFRTHVWPSGCSLTHKEALPMRMPLALTCGLVLLGLLAAAPGAHAVLADHSGTICKNYSAGDVAYVVSQSGGGDNAGTRSLKSESTWVICPLTRNTSSSNGAYIYVDITHFSNDTTLCFAYSYSYFGTLLAFATDTWSGSGFHELGLNLTGAYKSDAWSTYSVLCNIPGNSNGFVLDVDLSEY